MRPEGVQACNCAQACLPRRDILFITCPSLRQEAPRPTFFPRPQPVTLWEKCSNMSLGDRWQRRTVQAWGDWADTENKTPSRNVQEVRPVGQWMTGPGWHCVCSHALRPTPGNEAGGWLGREDATACAVRLGCGEEVEEEEAGGNDMLPRKEEIPFCLLKPLMGRRWAWRWEEIVPVPNIILIERQRRREREQTWA